VDIGANVGLFSMLARHRFPAATIHAYEPDPSVLEFTERNLSATGVSLYREGVASRDGQGEVVSLGSTRLNQINPVEDGSVRLTRLETVVARIGGEIDLLKLDCEGFEWDIFREEAAFAHVRTIRMEYHLIDGHTLDDLFAVTSKLGFRRTHLHPDNGFGIAWFDRDPAQAN
jgi:FkbM family methyltransferase